MNWQILISYCIIALLWLSNMYYTKFHNSFNTAIITLYNLGTNSARKPDTLTSSTDFTKRTCLHSSSIHLEGISNSLPSILYPISLSTMESRSSNRRFFSISPNGLLTVRITRRRGHLSLFGGIRKSSSGLVQSELHMSQQMRVLDCGMVSVLPRPLSKTILRQFSFPSQKFRRLVSVHFFSSWVSVKTCPLESTPPRPARPKSYNSRVKYSIQVKMDTI